MLDPKLSAQAAIKRDGIKVVNYFFLLIGIESVFLFEESLLALTNASTLFANLDWLEI